MGGIERKPGGSSLVHDTFESPHAPSTPGKRTLAEQLPHATHQASPRRVAEQAPTKPAATPNMVLTVVVYGQHGELINVWAAKGIWEGPLPQHIRGELGTRGWVWDDASAKSVRVNTRIDGSGGSSVEEWASRLHGARVEISANPVDVAADHDGARADAHEPAHGGDRNDGDDAVDTCHLEVSDPKGEQLADKFEKEFGINFGEDGEDGEGYLSGNADGRTGDDTSPLGTGPGGPHAKAGGQAEGSTTAHGNDGTKTGDRDGERLGSEGGRFGGEGHDGDHGVRGAGALFGGLLPVPEALAGAVELALLIEAGDLTGAGGSLFQKGIGKAASIAAARRIVAHEARIAAAKELRGLMKQLAAKKVFTALTKVERDQVLRVVYWENQRRFFRGYLAAAKAEKRAVRKALRTAKPSNVAALEARRLAADTGEEIAKVEPVAGRLPQNHAYAGKEFPRTELPPPYRKQGLRFKDTGYPDFEPYAKTLPNGKKTVHIEYRGSHEADFAAARKAVGLEKDPRGYTWHHSETEGEMLLVPTDLHDKVKHSGGVAEYKHRTGNSDYE